MREIKFRVARYEDGESVNVYDDVTGIDYDEEFEIYNARLKKGKWILNVIPLQYTGLKDRNGVEIYEHDIFRFGGRNYVIMYNLGSFGCFEDDKYFPLGEIFYRNGEVVGNIYENKELLEREAE